MRPAYRPGDGMRFTGGEGDRGHGYYVPRGLAHAAHDVIEVRDRGQPRPAREQPGTVVRQLFGGVLHPPSH